jgi:iron complex transport system substrate-binding protein
MRRALLLLALAVAAGLSQERGKVVYDDLNSPLVLNSRPLRIVSLAPNITEILFAIGLGERVVGVTRYCNYPPQAAEKEKVGGMVDPSLEKIQALRPDLVLAFRGNPLRVLSRLKTLHFPVFVLDTGKSLQDLFQTIDKVGRAAQEKQRADVLISSLEEKYRRVTRSLEKVKAEPRVFLLLHGQGLWTCGGESYLNDILVRAKGINIAGRIPRTWLQLNREQLIHENPDVIIVMAKDETRFLQAKERLQADSRLHEVNAIAKNKIYFIDEDIASRFGPRLLDALLEIARLLHPQCVNAGT